jgi:phenylalanyl-tRNA synthetase beta chain
MTILTFNRKELEKEIGKVTKEVEEQITMFGTPVEDSNANEISIEIFPNRPDLLSLQGFSRSFLQYLGKRGVSKFKVNKPEKDYVVKVDKIVKQVRPYTVCAIVKNIKFNDEKIKEIIEVQEKLHLTIGRKRKKSAIGIYPLEKIKLPIKYTAMKPEDIKFVPLESPGGKEMTGKQILRQHPKGQEYADLLKDESVYPVFLDSTNKVLSLPPIINSHETGKIDEKTKDVFVECSGFNKYYLEKTLNIIIATLADMGGKVYAMEIKDEKSFASPNLDFDKMEFKIEDINKTLGLDLGEKEIKDYLEKMGIGFEKDKKHGKFFALVPAYRVDVLHWVDLSEDIAIAYGYDNFEPEIPKIATMAKEDKADVLKRTIEEIFSGVGFSEVSSFHLAKKKDVKKAHYDFKKFIEVEDSKTEYDVLRIDLLSNLLKVFSENSDSAYPQKIFEVGKVFEKNEGSNETGVDEKTNLALAMIDEEITFTEMKQILDYLFIMLNVDYNVENAENSNYINGRVAKVIVNDGGKDLDIGFIGEIAPRVLKNWKLKMPTVALEINLDWLN